MKALAVGVLTLAVVAAGCAKSPEPEPRVAEQPPSGEAKGDPPKAEQPKPAREVPAALAAIFKERNKLHKRQTGALLTISAKWTKDPGVEEGFRVDWTIDYDGPRRPFTVVSPRSEINNPTTARFWYLKADGTAGTFQTGWGGMPSSAAPPRQKAQYMVAADGKTLTSHLSRGLSTTRMPTDQQFRAGDPPLWAQLEFAPTDRGDGYEVQVNPTTGAGGIGLDWTLDAWTGKLWSPVIEVTEK